MAQRVLIGFPRMNCVTLCCCAIRRSASPTCVPGVVITSAPSLPSKGEIPVQLCLLFLAERACPVSTFATIHEASIEAARRRV